MFALRRTVTLSRPLTQLRSFSKVINTQKGDTVLKSKDNVVSLTPAAVQRVKELLQDKPEGTGLYLSTTSEGCNGHQYALNYCNKGEEGKFDEIVMQDGIKVVVDANSIMYLLGTKIDFREDEISSEFVFDNPLATATCGCGESFSVEKGAVSKSHK